MSDWMIWSIAVVAVVILEIFTGTFYLLMIAIGLAAAAGAAWFGTGVTIQLIVGAVVGATATLALHLSRFGTPEKTAASRDPNAILDIGKTVNVNEWDEKDGGKRVARVMYRGAMWDVELEPGAESKPGVFIIQEIRGSRLIVKNAV
ncbi:MAG: NfeD family protein [Oxalobacter sp.]|nr:MAG: NfeD family protein [Oxalobacter sp.]